MKRICKILLLIACISFVSASFFACKKGDTEKSEISFELKEHFISIFEGESRKIEVLSDDNLTYTYEPSDETVVSVDGNGTVHGLKEGSSVITVKADELTDTMMVEVLKNERYISLNCVETNKVIGSKFDIVAVICEKNRIIDDEVVWTTSVDCEKTINGNTITLLPDFTGYIKITAAYRDLSAECLVKVVAVGATVLEKPIITVENCKTLTWQQVANATKYSVLTENGEWVDVNGNSFDVDAVDDLKYNEKIKVAVRAKTDNPDFIDSD